MRRGYGPKARRFIRGFRRPTQWLSSTQVYAATTNVIVAGASVGNTQFSILDTSQAMTGLGDPTIERYRLDRLVGDVMPIVNNAPTADGDISVDIGIILVDFTTAAGASVFSPLQVNDVDASWVTLRHWRFVVLNGFHRLDPDPQTNCQPGAGSHFDIKQKRVLRPNHRLVMQAHCVPQSGFTGGGLALRIFLRALISQAI